MSGEGEGGEGEGKLPSVDHGRRTDEGRDKNRLNHLFTNNIQNIQFSACILYLAVF